MGGMVCKHESVRLECCAGGRAASADAALGFAYVGGVCCAERTGSRAFPNVLLSGWYLVADFFASYTGGICYCPFCGQRMPSAPVDLE